MSENSLFIAAAIILIIIFIAGLILLSLRQNRILPFGRMKKSDMDKCYSTNYLESGESKKNTKKRGKYE